MATDTLLFAIMIPFIFLLSVIQIPIIVECTTPISYIDSAAYIPTNFSNVISYNGTCSACICFAFFSPTHPPYAALNCYGTNFTCLLFPSFLSRSNIHINTNSQFAYIPLSSSTAASCINVNGQCGGSAWSGMTNCCIGLSCIYKNASYSRCSSTLPVSTAIMSTESLMTSTYYNDSRVNTSTSTYWDCCKVSCGWPNKGPFASPPRTCKQDGITTIDSNNQSNCNGGGSYTCTDQQPWNVSGSLSYGYAGAYISNQTEWNWCCTCYSLLFTSGAVIGKELIVQAINTAYTSGNMFVLQIPGGGWGSSINGCPNQFGGSYSWGNPSGGITNRTSCSSLPSVLRAGCYWRFDWFLNAYNPSARYKEVPCPTALTSTTGCIRQ